MRRLIFLLFTWATLTVLAGCQPLIIPATPTAEGGTQSTEAAPPVNTTTVTTTTATMSETATLSETVVATAPIAESVTVSETQTVSETVEAATPAPTAAPSTENVESGRPMLTVLVASLRVRAGPGTEYAVIGAATQGEFYSIVGQVNDCQWYQIIHPQLAEAWVAGGTELVSSDTSCDQLSSIAPTAAPAIAPTSAPIATPAPAAPPAQPTDDPFPADQGCLLLQNQLGPPLTFTFTRSDGGFSDTFEVTSDGDVPYCLEPGYYRVTVDAPPPWSALNTEFQINAGERIYFPIRPQ